MLRKQSKAVFFYLFMFVPEMVSFLYAFQSKAVFHYLFSIEGTLDWDLLNC